MADFIDRILFATDLSDHSRFAFTYAAGLANRLGAGIVLFHMVEGLTDTFEERIRSFLGDAAWEEIRRSREDEARQLLIGKKSEREHVRKALEQFAAAMRRDREMDPFQTDEIIVQRDGNVAREIVNTAREHACDLILMGLKGDAVAGGAGRIGSQVKAVLKRSTIPVFVVPPPAAS